MSVRKLYCDNCMIEFELDQADFEHELGYSETLDLARFDGWQIGGMFNFCPPCQGDENE